jgi:hypothetical protein
VPIPCEIKCLPGNCGHYVLEIRVNQTSRGVITYSRQYMVTENVPAAIVASVETTLISAIGTMPAVVMIVMVASIVDAAIID